MHPEPQKFPLHRFFAGITESAFLSRVGLADPPLVDYISDLLVRFVHFDGVHQIRSLSGRRLIQVTDMVREAEQRLGPARRDAYRHIGDFTLFWAGMYPEALNSMKSAVRKDFFVDYCEQGKKSYRIAAMYRDDSGELDCDVLDRLSAQFDLCTLGLTEVRKELEHPDDGSRLTILT